tara:strand:- start:233 stop:454 length:222 start_codon:yes stop_codon:yes gene_type:complete
MKKLITAIFVIGLFFPVIAEAGFSPEGRKRKPRCRINGGVVVCRAPKPKKCTARRPCIPGGYFRNIPPTVIPN